jgi:hypothetical protein
MTPATDLRGALDPAATFEHAIGLVPLDWQRAYLRETRPAVVLKGRQTGASTAAAALAIHATVYQRDVNAVVVSPSLKQSTEIATRARTGLRNLGVRLVQDSTSMIRLANGSRILSLPGTARSVRGWTAKLLILDEAAFISPETFVAARALVATGGRLVVQSTPAAESGVTVRSDEVPTIDPAFLDAERRSMSPDEFDREYACAFGKAGASLFSLDRIAALFGDAS